MSRRCLSSEYFGSPQLWAAQTQAVYRSPSACHEVELLISNRGHTPRRASSAMRILLMTMMIAAAAPAQLPPYPATEKTTAVDDYFGTKVPDPYRWLEDDHS